MSTEQLIAEYKALPLEERQRVAEIILSEDEAWIPILSGRAWRKSAGAGQSRWKQP